MVSNKFEARNIMMQLASDLKCHVKDVPGRVESLVDRLDNLQTEINQMNSILDRRNEAKSKM